MEMEQLTAILEAIGNLGEGAKEFGFFWLTWQILSTLGGYALGATAIFLGYRVFKHIILACSCEGRFKRMREAAGIGTHGDLTPRQADAIVAKFLEMLKTQGQDKEEGK